MWTQMPSALDEGQPGGALGKSGGGRLTPTTGMAGMCVRGGVTHRGCPAKVEVECFSTSRELLII